MSGGHDVMELCARVQELEGKVEFLDKHFDLNYVKQLSEGDQKVAEVLKKGNTLEAVKLYRDLYLVGQASAKLAVKQIKSRVA